VRYSMPSLVLRLLPSAFRHSGLHDFVGNLTSVSKKGKGQVYSSFEGHGHLLLRVLLCLFLLLLLLLLMLLLRCTRLRSFFADTVDARARVDTVVYGPIRAFAAIGERARNFLETGIQREVVADGVLSKNGD